jgi:hypothetical protein
VFLGLMPYLDPKGEGDNSMAANQWSGPGIWDDALRDPRNMVKALLPESQSPEGPSLGPPERRLRPVPALRRHNVMVDATSGVWSDVQRGHFKEMSGTPKLR